MRDERDEVEYINKIIGNFNVGETVKFRRKIKKGTVNNTILLEGRSKKYILQRLNSDVFKNPKDNMNNIKIYIETAKKEIELNDYSDWCIPKFYTSTLNNNYYIDGFNNYWRLYDYIEGIVHDKPRSLKQIKELGRGLARMHKILKCIPKNKIVPFSKNFHNIEYYYNEYLNLKNDKVMDEYCEDIISSNFYSMINCKINSRKLTGQVIHGDSKIANMIFDVKEEVISFIDLDTLYYAPIVIDISDCLRSITNSAGDVPTEYMEVKFSKDILKEFLKEYKEVSSGKILSNYDVVALECYIKMLPFELGLRFYTDYINNNRYFPVINDKDNLLRAKSQFKLFEEMTKCDIGKIVLDIFKEELNEYNYI